jgi:hypothetical protein
MTELSESKPQLQQSAPQAALQPAAPPRDSSEHARRNRRMLSDLWLMSAATFRRSGKAEQSKAAIQEAEVLDEENPGVWVQVRLSLRTLRPRPG